MAAAKTKKAPARTRRLTPTETAILAMVGQHEGEPCSKAEIARELGRNQKTIDRLIAGLSKDGLLVVEHAWGKNGAQLANTYRLPRARRRSAKE